MMYPRRVQRMIASGPLEEVSVCTLSFGRRDRLVPMAELWMSIRNGAELRSVVRFVRFVRDWARRAGSARFAKRAFAERTKDRAGTTVRELIS